MARQAVDTLTPGMSFKYGNQPVTVEAIAPTENWTQMGGDQPTRYGQRVTVTEGFTVHLSGQHLVDVIP